MMTRAVEEVENTRPVRLLLVRAGGLLCGILVESVRHLLTSVGIYPLPGARVELLGLAQYGGEPVVVLDLARLIKASPGDRSLEAVTVIVETEKLGALGLSVDDALEIVDADLTGSAGGEGIVGAELMVEGRLVRMLDLEKLGEG